MADVLKYQSKEVLNLVLQNASKIGITSYQLSEILSMVFDEANTALRVSLDGGTPSVASIKMAAGTVPAIPDAGYVMIWFDTADKHLKTRDDTGAVTDLTATASSSPTDYKDFNKVASVTNPAASDARMWVDTNGIAHLQDENGEEILMASADVKDGIAGAVGVVDNVQTGMLSLILEANPFRNNALLRTADEVTLGAAAYTNRVARPSGLVDGDICLIRAEVVSSTLATAGTIYFATLNGDTTADFSLVSDTLTAGSVYWFLATIDSGGSSDGFAIVNGTSAGTGSAVIKYAMFNKTNLGTLTTNQALAVNSLASVDLYNWTLTGTVDNTTAWSAIATWLGTESERNEFWALVIDKHVSGYDPVEVSKVVNRGGNLALIDGFEDGRLNASGVVEIASNTTASAVNDAMISVTTDAASTGVTSPYHKISKSLQHAFDITQVTGLGLVGHIAYYDNDKTFISRDTKGTASGTFTPPSNAVYFRYDLIAVATGDFQVNEVQINEGATANTYSTPLNSPLIVGSRSANQLSNGNGEKGTYGWETLNSTVIFDGVDFEVTNTGNYGRISQDVNGVDGTIIVTITAGVVTTTARILVYMDKQMDIDPSGFTWAASGYYYNNSVAVGDFSAYFEGINIIEFQVNSIGIGNSMKFREIMLAKGEYTLAQMQALGYVAHDPIVLHNSGDGTDNKSDSMEQTGDVINVIHNVETLAGYSVGDPDVDSTELLPAGTGNRNLDFSVNVADKTAFNTAYDWAVSSLMDDAVVAANVLTLTESTDANSRMVIGGVLEADKKYKYQLNISAITNTWELTYYNDVSYGSLGVTFTTTGIKTGHFSTPSDATGHFGIRNTNNGVSSISIDAGTTNNSIKAYNIYKSTAPTVEDITPFCNGSLNQPADNGQNHIITHGGIVKSVHREGIGGIVDNLSAEIQSKASKTDLNIPQDFSITSTAGMAASATLWVPFSDIDGIDDYFDNIKKHTETLDVNISTVDYYDNGVLITADGTGTGAGDELVYALVSSGKPKINHTVA